MKREDQELLLKDLCARLPYGVKCLVNYTFCNETTDYKDVEASNVDTIIMINQQTESYFFEGLSEWFDVDEFKPYLFPLSSMTEEQKKEFIQYAEYDVEESLCGRHYEYYLSDYVGTPEKPLCNYNAIDWCNKNHIDYRGWIEKGEAIDATGLNIY